jgi:hypothetical protein
MPPHLDAAALRAWSQPGWIKAGMEFRLEPVPAGTLLSTETRVLATDPKTRRAFAAYWFVIRPSSSAIRREVLKVVARRAESPLPGALTCGTRHKLVTERGGGSEGLTRRSASQHQLPAPMPRDN